MSGRSSRAQHGQGVGRRSAPVRDPHLISRRLLGAKVSRVKATMTATAAGMAKALEAAQAALAGTAGPRFEVLGHA